MRGLATRALVESENNGVQTSSAPTFHWDSCWTTFCDDLNQLSTFHSVFHSVFPRVTHAF